LALAWAWPPFGLGCLCLAALGLGRLDHGPMITDPWDRRELPAAPETILATILAQDIHCKISDLRFGLVTSYHKERGPASVSAGTAAVAMACLSPRVPLDWATTQMNLGNALKALGERGSDAARLEGAVAASRAALEEYTRASAPLDWAAAQFDLGIALRALGERESGTARLEEAVAVALVKFGLADFSGGMRRFYQQGIPMVNKVCYDSLLS
jgi:tetratricopeptide (TPR) repeat protein